jgi:hypothetical protein
MKTVFHRLLPLLLLLASCTKDENNPPAATTGTVSFQLGYNTDGKELLFDTVYCMNAAGNEYEVTNLEFILSNFKFIRADKTFYADTNAYYLNARDADFGAVNMEGIPNGTYTSMSFSLGLDSAHNITGGLPNTMEFIAMAWPDAMGGGYHFMKFEGHFVDGSNLPGFAMHLGMNMNRIDYSFDLPITVNNNSISLTLAMNVNEWFNHPEVYDFNVDPNYSMGNQSAMGKLSANGADVFTLNIK